MSNVTANTYPVISVSKAGDQFLVVQGGQLKKLTRAGLEGVINNLTATTVLELVDTPASYVGQQGKVLVVGPDEESMVFEAATAGNFLALSDTPAGYGGSAGQLAVVNGAENALEFIDNAYIALSDTPASYSGASEKIVRVNTAATATEFVTPTEAAPSANITGGFFDYAHGGGTQSFTAGGGPLQLLNDEAGGFTIKTYAPPGVTDVWNSTTNQFDWSELSLGDEIEIRFDYDVTTTVANQSIETNITLAIGSGIEYTLRAKYEEYKAAATYPVRGSIKIYMGNTETLNNPGEIRFDSDDDATVQVNGWYTSISRRGAV